MQWSVIDNSSHTHHVLVHCVKNFKISLYDIQVQHAPNKFTIIQHVKVEEVPTSLPLPSSSCYNRGQSTILSIANALEVLFLPCTTMQMWQNYSEILHSAFHQTHYITVNTRKTQNKFGSTCDVFQYVIRGDKTVCQK